jgi:predicted DsbA family dithiol-disulfide isomerase
MTKLFEDVEGITNVDVDKDKETAAQYGVRRIPTFVFLKNDKEVYRKSGTMTLEEYESVLTEINDAKELNDIEVIEPKFETGEE